MPERKKRANTKNQGFVDKIKDKSSAAYERAQDQIDYAKDYAEETIADNPFISVAIAAGVGALVGASVALGISAFLDSMKPSRSKWSRLTDWF